MMCDGEGIALYNGRKTSARPKNFLPPRKFLDPVKQTPNPEIFLRLRSQRAQLDADPSDNVSQRALPSRRRGRAVRPSRRRRAEEPAGNAPRTPSGLGPASPRTSGKHSSLDAHPHIRRKRPSATGRIRERFDFPDFPVVNTTDNLTLSI